MNSVVKNISDLKDYLGQFSIYLSNSSTPGSDFKFCSFYSTLDTKAIEAEFTFTFKNEDQSVAMNQYALIVSLGRKVIVSIEYEFFTPDLIVDEEILTFSVGSFVTWLTRQLISYEDYAPAFVRQLQTVNS